MPLFQGTDEVFRHQLALALKPVVAAPGEVVIREGDMGNEMYVLVKGEVDVVGADGRVLAHLGEGSFFGEIGLLLSEPRNASVRAATYCELFVLDKADFNRVLRDHPQFAKTILDTARSRYKVKVEADQAFDRQVSLMMK